MQVETRNDIYTVTECIHVHSYFKVYHCQASHSGVRCRLKEISKSGIPRDVSQDQVNSELEIWKTVNHPHIPKLIEIYESESAYIIVTEFFAGESLYPMTANGNCVTEKRVRPIFAQLLDVMDYLHSQQIFLRNLSPENVVIDSKDNIAICDFGFAIKCAPTDFLSDFFGKEIYSAPEMLEKVEYCGPAVDVWSMGMILYCLLSEVQPWTGEDHTRLFYAILTDPLRRQPQMSYSVFTLLQHMLIRDVRQRFSLTQVKQHYWLSGDEQKAGCNANIQKMFGRILTTKNAEKMAASAIVSSREPAKGKLFDELHVQPPRASSTARRKATGRPAPGKSALRCKAPS